MNEKDKWHAIDISKPDIIYPDFNMWAAKTLETIGIYSFDPQKIISDALKISFNQGQVLCSRDIDAKLEAAKEEGYRLGFDDGYEAGYWGDLENRENDK